MSQRLWVLTSINRKKQITNRKSQITFNDISNLFGIWCLCFEFSPQDEKKLFPRYLPIFSCQPVARKWRSNPMSFGLLIFVFVLAIFLGVELISKVPSQLHTPLMSGTNAISGITIVGALIAAGGSADLLGSLLGTAAVIFATINVVGGYLVTNRMLAMFKRKSGEKK
jgi:NAD(P) transhydrogenase subunit alpha